MIRVILRLLLVLLVIAVAGLVYALWPRTADLRGFDAAAVGRLETAMWRDYYAKDYRSLATNLYSLYRDVYHFSPTDSLRLAYDAGKAAQIFQPSKSRAEAQAALPLLVSYYTILRDHSGESFDPAKAARLELEWWQMRREAALPWQYGPVVAQVAEVVFGVTNDSVEKSGLRRAQMMQYRDEHRLGIMQPEDWRHIETNLVESYEALKAGVARNQAASQ